MKKKDINLYDYILKEVMNNPKVTEKFIAKKYLISERTVRRYIKILKSNKKIMLIGIGNNREWKIL